MIYDRDNTLAMEIGYRAMGDLLSENGPARMGVIYKRFYTGYPKALPRPIVVKVVKDKPEWIWSTKYHSKFKVLRMSKKGNMIVDPSTGVPDFPKRVKELTLLEDETMTYVYNNMGGGTQDATHGAG